VLVPSEADARELGVGRVDLRAEWVEVLVVSRAVAIAGAAPAGGVTFRPVVLGRFAACARPWPSRPDAAPKRAARGRGQNGDCSQTTSPRELFAA
jgi:hypothetical protein